VLALTHPPKGCVDDHNVSIICSYVDVNCAICARNCSRPIWAVTSPSAAANLRGLAHRRHVEVWDP
jgi:hypothetical protein